MIQVSFAQISCPPELNYGECSCVSLETDLSVNVMCKGKTNQEIQESFANAPSNVINSFELVPKLEKKILLIGANLLADKQARSIMIKKCPTASSTGSLEIDPSAFALSKTFTQTFSIVDCPIGKLEWGFLTGFNKLTIINLENIQEVQSVQSLPLLKKLSQLVFKSCSGLESLPFPGSSLPALKSLALENNKLNDEKVQEILSTLTTTVLQKLTLANSADITKVPEKLERFSTLTSIDLSTNSIARISSNAFGFPSDSNILLIDLTGNKVETIEEGAFSRGNFIAI